jgi:hypothetical protein
VTRQDPQKVFERNRNAIAYALKFYFDIRAELGDPPLHLSDLETSMFIGEPDSVLGMLEPYVRQFGLTDMIYSGLVSGFNRADARESLRLFGEEVLPVLKTW